MIFTLEIFVTPNSLQHPAYLLSGFFQLPAYCHPLLFLIAEYISLCSELLCSEEFVIHRNFRRMALCHSDLCCPYIIWAYLAFLYCSSQRVSHPSLLTPCCLLSLFCLFLNTLHCVIFLRMRRTIDVHLFLSFVVLMNCPYFTFPHASFVNPPMHFTLILPPPSKSLHLSHHLLPFFDFFLLTSLFLWDLHIPPPESEQSTHA